MGYLSRNTCHVTALEASAAACSAYPVEEAASGVVVTFSCTGYTTSELALSRTASDGSPAVAQTLPVAFASCNESAGYTDAMGAWALAAGAVFLVAVMRAAWDRVMSPQG
jgi:hypothetical protein